MKTILKHYFLVMTLVCLGILFLAEDVKYELPSVMMFAVALFGFVMTATDRGKRKVRI